MRFLVNEDFFRGSVGHKSFQNMPDMRTFDAAGQLAVRERAGPAFTELDVGLRVQAVLLLQGQDVPGAKVHGLSALNQHGGRAGAGEASAFPGKWRRLSWR